MTLQNDASGVESINAIKCSNADENYAKSFCHGDVVVKGYTYELEVAGIFIDELKRIYVRYDTFDNKQGLALKRSFKHELQSDKFQTSIKFKKETGPCMSPLHDTENTDRKTFQKEYMTKELCEEVCSSR